jgi:hypothetical protein
MNGLLRISCGWLALALLTLAAWGSVSAGAGPIVKQRTESAIEIDLGMIVDDFVPPLEALAAAEDETAPAKIRALMGLLGLNALDRLHIESSVNDERGISSLTVTLDPSADGGFLGDVFAIPTSRFGFGRYLKEDEAILVVYAAGIGERIAAFEAMFARPELRELAPMAPTDPLSLTAMWGVDARKDILPFLSGELGLIVFPCGADEECEVPKAALVLGLTDGPAFRETILNILGNILGEEPAAELRAMEGEPAGSFTFYPVMPGVSYAIAPDFGIVTTDPELLKEVVARRKGGFPTIDASSYVRVNGDLLVEMLAGLVAKAGADSPQAGIVAEVLRVVGEEPVGTIELTGKTSGGRAELEVRAPSSLYAAEYRFLKELFAAAPELAALDAQGKDLHAIVHEVDAALTRYGEEHDGTFPLNFEELVAAGYLDAVPDLTETPLGQYVDGGYTYLPLLDETGSVAGHYFFVYGAGENSGHDVFTPENLEANASTFRVAKDGARDGVVGFSFDGVAIEHVEAWNRE